ncbi:BC1872 family protein [Aneurinibacillus terranovensis]|uniref:BC1872 family protein n=1 Tax=Aneurinibacillus terranovensis TaxID=278991 RepID=UPI0003F7C360|nr:hypothetical protein [Aneurinibacillus terranovensis]
MTNREIDALVAERIFGWENPLSSPHLPHFSTSITDAWEVAEKIKEGGWHMVLHSSRGYICDLSNKGTVVVGYGPSASLAICLASLKAVSFS